MRRFFQGCQPSGVIFRKKKQVFSYAHGSVCTKFQISIVFHLVTRSETNSYTDIYTSKHRNPLLPLCLTWIWKRTLCIITPKNPSFFENHEWHQIYPSISYLSSVLNHAKRIVSLSGSMTGGWTWKLLAGSKLSFNK